MKKKLVLSMLFNNSHPDCRKLNVKSINEVALDLHQFKWSKNVGSLYNIIFS